MAVAGPPDGFSVCLAHVTDVHFGRDAPGTIDALLRALRDVQPQVVVVGGDLTQRARAAQFRRARAFLDALPAPWLAVPGNHDVPLYDLFRRVLFPLGRYRRFITRHRAPLWAGDGLRVLGLDTTRRKVVGRLQPERVRQIARLGEGDPGALRVLVTHHPLVRRPCEGAALALAAAERSGTDVLLAGHYHHAHLTRGTALGVEGPSPSHLLEPVKGFYVVRADATTITAELWTYDGTAFTPAEPRTFPRRDRLA